MLSWIGCTIGLLLLGTSYGLKASVSLPFSLTSRLDSRFERNTSQPFSFVDIGEENNQLSAPSGSQYLELLAARQAAFISFSSEFTDLIGVENKVELLAAQPTHLQFAHEGGTFVPETGEVWFTANQMPVQNTNVSSLNLKTNAVAMLSVQLPIVTPNGLQYFDGLVYICSQGNKTTPGAIYAVNPTTLVSRLIVNSWFGLRLNSPNDLTFTTKIGGRPFMWFTDPQVAFMQNFGAPPQLGSYVYRLDLTNFELRPVITDLKVPNGIAFDQTETTLYVTDAALVYAYDLNQDGLPTNRRTFSVSSLGIADGIKTDTLGRVWIAEGDGINVRDRSGKLLGVILGRDLCESGVISNFALLNDTLIILAQEKLWRFKLTIH